MKVVVPPKDKWSQRWTDREVKAITKVAHEISKEEAWPDSRSLWRSAEEEFRTPRYIKEQTR